MKRVVFVLLLQFVGLMAIAKIDITKLTIEYRTNPIGIDIERPRFSWVMESDERNVQQKAYQILVTSAPENAREARSDIWDSGKINSAKSVLIPFSGKALSSEKRYYWKVRVWDQKGNVSESTEIAFWEMGLLTQNDWKGEWITAPKVYDWKSFVADRKVMIKEHKEDRPDPAPQFRKSFSFSKDIVQARLYISGIGYNIPYLNGKKVGDHILDAAFTRYDKTVLYTTFDVTNALKPGENVLGVVLGNGWYNLSTKAVWGFDHAPWRDNPTLKAQLEIVFKDGSHQTIVSDKSWKVAPGPIVFNSIRQGEFYDARKETSGWNNSHFNDEKWAQSVEVKGPAGKLKAQMIQPIKIIETITPKKITEPKPGVYVLDLGRNIAGFAQIKIKAPAGTEIMIKYGELLYEDGTIDQRDIAQHVAGGMVQTDKYTCKGEGIEIWHPAFVYHGFQYIEVSGLPQKPLPETITGMLVHSAFESAGSFQCSNELFNKIQQAALNSFSNNFTGYPTDCPQREKNGWTADAHLAAELGLYNFKAQNGYEKWLGDIADEQQPSGELAAIVPSSGWGYFWGNGPAWDNAMVLIPWYLYQYNGDQSILAQMYPNIKRYVDYLGTRANNHIVSFGLGDWVPAKTSTPAEITSTAYYYIDAVLLSKMAGIFGHQADQKKYADLAIEIKTAFNKKYYKGNGIYDEGSQTSLSCALYQGMTDDHSNDTFKALVSAVQKNGNKLDCGILGTKYLLHALSDNGRPDVAYEIVNQRTFPSWGHWIAQGATTLWEQWNGTESRNHVMFGDVSAWFYKNLAGIAPNEMEAGFKRISLKPYFAPDLKWVKADHQSMYGEIKAGWERKNNDIYYHITIPANTTAELALPLNKKIFVNGKVLAKSAYVDEIREEGNEKKFNLMSGSYVVVIK